jgi:hypothetical protein
MKIIANICSNRVLVDCRIKKESMDELNRMGVTVYKSTLIKSLYDEISGHPDIQIHFIANKAICAPEVYNYYCSLNIENLELICGSSELKSEYPLDIAYNVCSLGKYVICRPLCTATEILSEYHNLKKEILITKQGYAKCSICVVNDESAITADEGIYKLLNNHEINVLKIRKGHIELNNMEGFIGGASGLIDERTLCFNGNLKTHPDYHNIVDFCNNVNVDVVSLNNGPLKDVGSILRF